jgi:hypothetical protein
LMTDAGIYQMRHLQPDVGFWCLYLYGIGGCHVLHVPCHCDGQL